MPGPLILRELCRYLHRKLLLTSSTETLFLHAGEEAFVCQRPENHLFPSSIATGQSVDSDLFIVIRGPQRRGDRHPFVELPSVH